MKEWTVKQCENAKPGRHRVSKGLYLYVTPDGETRRFLSRYTKPLTGRVTETGLGLIGDTTLKEAKDNRDELRQLVSRGIDPVEQKREAKLEAKRETEAQRTFADVAAEFVDIQSQRFRNPNSTKNVQVLLFTHASDLSEKPIAQIGSAHIAAALHSLWMKKPHQARRTLAAVLQVMRYAKAKGLCDPPVAEWREHMRHLIPHVNGTKRHFAALPYEDIPAFVQQLRSARDSALSPSVIEFIVLTAARENEVCGMQWGEIDLQEEVWTLPPERSKVGREHRVPLSKRALTLLVRQRGPEAGLEPDPTAYVWPGRSWQRPVTGKSVYKYLTKTLDVHATIHGFRSTFRDWAGDMTHFAHNDIEECLAHSVGDATVRAYRRKDALEKRRVIMEAWADYCEGR